MKLSTDETVMTAVRSEPIKQRKFFILAKCPLFRNAKREVLEEIADCAAELTLAPSEILFSVGQPATVVYALADGMVKLFAPDRDGTEVLAQIVGAGEMLGLIPLLSDGVNSDVARSVGTVHALAWPAAEFERLLMHLPSLSHEALQVFARHLRMQESRCWQLLSEQAPQRLARTLLRLTRLFGDQHGDLAGEIPLPRIELAQLTGMSLFTVSRILSAWDDERIIRARREKVIVEDSSALHNIAEAGRSR